MSAIIKRVFVLKHSAKGNDSGTVTPVAYEDSNGNITAVDAEKDYPSNGRIYISNNYEESIEKNMVIRNYFICITTQLTRQLIMMKS